MATDARTKTHALLALVAVLALLVGCGGEGNEGATKAEPSAQQRSSTQQGSGSSAESGSSAQSKSSAEQVSSANLRPLALTLDSYPAPDHAGILLAFERGFFADVGLEVNVHTPVSETTPLGYVLGRDVDLAISYEPEVLLAREKGQQVVAVGNLLNRPTASMIWLKDSGIRNVGDLEGKTIATTGLAYQEGYLKTILARAGLSLDDVRLLRIGYGLVPTLVSGRADAIIGASWNVEGIELRLRGLEPVVTPVSRLGVPHYDQLVVIARPDRLRRDPDTIRDFLRAVVRGTAMAIADPAAATDAVLNSLAAPHPRLVAAEMEATVPLLSESGRMDASEWSRFAAWMAKQGLLDQVPSSQPLTNDYLPAGSSSG